MKRAFFLVTLMMLLLLPVMGWTADWYCATTGTNGDGTEANPWVGFSNIVWGAGGVQAGDTLHLYKGQTYSSALITGANGTSSAWIRIIGDAGDGSGYPIISADNTASQSLRIRNEYIDVSQLKLIPAWTGAAGDAAIKIRPESNGHVKIHDCVIGDGPDQDTVGIGVSALALDFAIYNNDISGCHIGIMVDTAGAGGPGKIHHNKIHHVLMGTGTSGDAMRIINADYSGLCVYDNEIWDYNADGIDCYGASNVIVEHNIIHDPDDSVGPDNGIKLGGAESSGNKALRNIVYNIPSTNAGSGIYTNGLVNGLVAYNLVYNSNRGIFDSSDNNEMYNNTLVECTTAIQIGSGLTATVTNNILDGSNHDLYVDTDSTVSGGHNCFKNDSSVSGSGTYGGTGDLFATDPLLTSTYHLSANSPCINAGTTISGFHETALDIDEQPILGTPDIGCDERKALWWDGRRWHMQRMY